MAKQITAHQLIALASVASTRSLTESGISLHRTQSAVSAQLKQLSEAIGAPIVTRQRYGVILTPSAEALLPYAHACVRALEGAQQAAGRLRGLEQGQLRVLASTSVAVYLLPPVLAAFHAKHPGIELRIKRHHARDALSAFERGDSDIAVVRGATSLSSTAAVNFVVRTLLTDKTLLIVPNDHALAARKKIRPEQLDGIELVTREAGSATGGAVERMAARAKINFRVKFQTVGVEALKEAVLQGFGAGFLSQLSVQREIDAGLLRAIHVEAPELVQHITMVYPALGQSPPAVEKFIEILESLKPSRKYPPSMLKLV